VTPEQVRAFRPPAWQTAAALWRTLAAVLAGHAARLRDLADRLSGSWTGSAADAALARLRALARAFDAGAAGCLAVDQALAEFADRVAQAQAALPDTEPAARADEAAAARLSAALGDLGDAPPAWPIPGAAPPWPSPGAAPPWPSPGAGPAAVRRWWDALTAADRMYLLAEQPGRLGVLDGVPVDVRDRANRLALAVVGDTPPLRALRARLASADAPRAYLLAFDASGDGRAVVAIRDPDHADNVLTYVPGTGASVGDLGKGVLLPAADRLATTAGPSTAVVLWLGYDAPDNPIVASYPTYAKHAEDALDRFQDGLRATHQGTRAHQTVLGHSYGSTVVGFTARDRGLDADDVIFVGSPGVGVTHAGDLGVPPGHVWASTAQYDPIRLTTAGHAIVDSAVEVLRPPSGPDLWFGTDPTRTDFGGQVFGGVPGSPLRPVKTHDGYFDPANPAFDTIVGITRP
jgi:hypothetical protein